MRTEIVKPARTGLKVRDPERGDHLSEEGAAVPLNSYWLRRKADGDVVPAKASAAKPLEPVKQTKSDATRNNQ